MRRLIFPIACLFLISGCATIASGTTQSIAFSTPGVDGAQCSLTSSDGSYSVVTPGSVTVGRSRHDIKVRCVKQGYQDGISVVSSRFEEWTAGNLLVGGFVGLGVDAASGAQNEYPKNVQIVMRKK